jgi:hypothetical protein
VNGALSPQHGAKEAVMLPEFASRSTSGSVLRSRGPIGQRTHGLRLHVDSHTPGPSRSRRDLERFDGTRAGKR